MLTLENYFKKNNSNTKMTDSVKDEIKDTCKPVLDHKDNEQVVVTNEAPIISCNKDIKKVF